MEVNQIVEVLLICNLYNKRVKRERTTNKRIKLRRGKGRDVYNECGIRVSRREMGERERDEHNVGIGLELTLFNNKKLLGAIFFYN